MAGMVSCASKSILLFVGVACLTSKPNAEALTCCWRVSLTECSKHHFISWTYLLCPVLAALAQETRLPCLRRAALHKHVSVLQAPGLAVCMFELQCVRYLSLVGNAAAAAAVAAPPPVLPALLCCCGRC